MDDFLPGANQRLIAETKALIEKNQNLIDKLSTIHEERIFLRELNIPDNIPEQASPSVEAKEAKPS